MGCATEVVKYLVFIANLIFALAGLALIVVGVLIKLQVSKIDEVLPRDFAWAPILSIVVGAIVFITAFLGCCGAVKESPCMLTTFAIILLTIFIIQVAIGVYAFLQIRSTDELKKKESTALTDAFRDYPRTRELVDFVQGIAQCCGTDGPGYWYTHFHNDTVPASCCAENVKPCTSHVANYRSGCIDRVFDLLMQSSKIIGGVAIGIAAVEIIGAIFGLCLASSIRNHYRRNIYA